MEEIRSYALDLGAADAKFLSSSMIPVKEALADICREPGCPGYGVSGHCPPFSMTPPQFKELLENIETALFFKFEVPSEVLLTEERHEVSRLIHQTAAAVERFAMQCGYTRSRGFAAGSCKKLFCDSFARCRVVFENGPCRHPDLSRTSMSAVGVDFSTLTPLLDWRLEIIGAASSDPSEGRPLASMMGMVLIG